jgi:hypothetical protein
MVIPESKEYVINLLGQVEVALKIFSDSVFMRLRHLDRMIGLSILECISMKFDEGAQVARIDNPGKGGVIVGGSRECGSVLHISKLI